MRMGLEPSEVKKMMKVAKVEEEEKLEEIVRMEEREYVMGMPMFTRSFYPRYLAHPQRLRPLRTPPGQ